MPIQLFQQLQLSEKSSYAGLFNITYRVFGQFTNDKYMPGSIVANRGHQGAEKTAKEEEKRKRRRRRRRTVFTCHLRGSHKLPMPVRIE